MELCVRFWSNHEFIHPVHHESLSCHQSKKPLKVYLQRFLGPFSTFQRMCLVERWLGFSFSYFGHVSETEHLILLDSPGRLQSRDMPALEDNGFLVVSRWILLKSLGVFAPYNLNTFLPTSLTICNKMFDGVIDLLKVLHPPERLFFYKFYFSN